jgi:predicted dehydrogenase
MKVLIIGLGSIGKKHVAALRCINPSIQIDALRSSNTNVELEGICNYYDFNDIKRKIHFRNYLQSHF